MDKKCPVCFGIGWVCENHPDRAWDDELGCRCGAGMPCRCNSADEPDTSEIIAEKPTKSQLQGIKVAEFRECRFSPATSVSSVHRPFRASKILEMPRCGDSGSGINRARGCSAVNKRLFVATRR